MLSPCATVPTVSWWHSPTVETGSVGRGLGPACGYEPGLAPATGGGLTGPPCVKAPRERRSRDANPQARNLFSVLGYFA